MKKNDFMNLALILMATVIAIGIIVSLSIGITSTSQSTVKIVETVAVITDETTITTVSNTKETILTTQSSTTPLFTTIESTSTTTATIPTTNTTTTTNTTITTNTTNVIATTTTTTIEPDPPTPPMPEEEVYEEEENETDNKSLTIVNQMTYYSGKTGCKGASGRQLLNDYSVACNSVPLGSIVHIESGDGSVCGDYRVDDTGGMSNNVIDIFYSSYDNVPSSFKRDGRVSCTVWIVE